MNTTADREQRPVRYVHAVYSDADTMAKPAIKNTPWSRATSRDYIYTRAPAMASKMVDRCASSCDANSVRSFAKRLFYE